MQFICSNKHINVSFPIPTNICVRPAHPAYCPHVNDLKHCAYSEPRAKRNLECTHEWTELTGVPKCITQLTTQSLSDYFLDCAAIFRIHILHNLSSHTVAQWLTRRDTTVNLAAQLRKTLHDNGSNYKGTNNKAAELVTWNSSKRGYVTTAIILTISQQVHIHISDISQIQASERTKVKSGK
jgi:hypothetical protein